MRLPKTIFLDVDGCVLEHEGKGACHQWSSKTKLLPNVREKFNEWEKMGHYIVLVTARKESTRLHLEYLLRSAGLFWDELIMGISHGERILINDVKRQKTDDQSARCIVLMRNEGLGKLKI